MLAAILPTHTGGLHGRWDALFAHRNKYLDSAQKMLLESVVQLDALIDVIPFLPILVEIRCIFFLNGP